MKSIEWQAPEFDYYKKDVSWYWLVIIVSIIVALIALWQKNLLFAIFIAVASIMIVVWGRRKPRIIEYRLNSDGLQISGKLYDLKSFDGFYIDDEKLVLKHKARFRTYFKIQIDIEKKEAIENRLQHILPEIEYSESLIEAVSQWLGF